MKKNGILTLLFACIPGAGQMYQGYMKRGLSLITMFCLFIILGSTTGLDALVVGCIVVYMYSFFDTLNLRAQLAAEKAPEDDYLVHFNWHDARMTQFMGESHKLVGWGLIALGAIVIGTLIGAAMALMRVSGNRVLGGIARGYTCNVMNKANCLQVAEDVLALSLIHI